VTINVPAIDGTVIARTEATAWATGSGRTYWYGPGESINGFREDGSFGEITAGCLFIETVRDQWKPGERLCLEASIVVPLERLEIHVRAWATWKAGEGVEQTQGDPGWGLAGKEAPGVVLDQQGIPAYRISFGF